MKKTMTDRITTYKELCQEHGRLKQKLQIQKAEFRHHLGVLQDKLSPVEKIAGVVKNFTTPDTRNPFVNTGLNLTIDLLLRNFYMAKVGWIPKLVVPFVLKNLSSNFVNKKGKSILHTLKSLIGKNGKVKTAKA
jgi:hypothetical protein